MSKFSSGSYQAFCGC